MIESTHRLIGIADQAATHVQAQVETEWHAHERARKAEQFTSLTSDNRSEHQRRADGAAWKEQRTQELTGDVIAEGVPNDVLNPPTAAEETAEASARIASRNDREKEFAEGVGGISARGTKKESATKLGWGQERAEGEERPKSFREAVAEKEREAQFGTSEIRTGYGPNAIDEKPALPPPNAADLYELATTLQPGE